MESEDSAQENQGDCQINETQTEQSTSHVPSQQPSSFEFQHLSALQSRSKYGNMIVIMNNKYGTLTLGPNYCFFIFAYAAFTIATYYLVNLVNNQIQNKYFQLFNFCFCWGQNLSYILIAFSNPGIVHQNPPLNENEQSKRFCKKCCFIMKRGTYHCRQCNVCIYDYDHHCPWTSKCIGGGNINRFYFFVCMTPFYIFYYMIVFMICFAEGAIQNNHNLKSGP